MKSNIVPYLAIQIVSRASVLSVPGQDAPSVFRALSAQLPHLHLQVVQENEERVIFTARDAQRVVTVVLSRSALEEQAVSGEALLLLMGGTARFDWTFVRND